MRKNKRSQDEEVDTFDLDQVGSWVLDALPRAVVVSDLNGRIVGWNSRAEITFGRSRTEVLGSAYDTIVSKENRARAQALRALVLSGDRWSGESVVQLADGTTRHLFSFLAPLRDSAGQVIGVVSAAEDLSEQRALKKQATDLADHLVLALVAGQLGTWRWDLRTGETTWDHVAEALFGFEPGGFDGTYDRWVSLLHPEDREATLASVADAIANKASYEVSHRVVWPDGSVHWLRGRGQVTLDGDGRVTGSIGCVGDDTTRRTNEIDAERRTVEAEQRAISERVQRERIEFLSALNDAALSATDHRELMRATAAAAVPRLGDWCAVSYLTHPGMPPETEIVHSDPARVDWARELQLRYPYDPDATSGVAAVMRTGITEHVELLTSELIDRALEGSSYSDIDELRKVITDLGITSAITVPLVTRHGVVGAIQFVTAESRRRYGADDVALAEAAAGRIADAINNAWMSDHQHDVSAKLQAALLPATLPAIEGLEVAVRYRAGASMAVGGDFYDVFRLGPNRWALAIGDVCGTGPDAASVTGKARHTIRAAATHGVAAPDVMEWLNDAIIAGERGLFCTAVYGTLDRLDGGRWRLTTISAGHPLPVLRTAGGSVDHVGVPGTLLGVLPEIEVTPTETILGGGDTIVLYTDGITDVRPPFALDEAELLELVRKSCDGATDANAMASNLIAEIEKVLPIHERNDDLAIVVLRVAGVATGA